MKIKELLEAEKLPAFKNGKAGCIPYIIDNGEPKMAFLVSSDANFGGGEPMIAKGGIDGNESPKEAGIREAEEELGLRRSNIVDGTIQSGWSGELEGLKHNYKFDVFMCQVKSQKDFDTPGRETKEVLWFTLEEFKAKGRKSHLHIVETIVSKIKEM